MKKACILAILLLVPAAGAWAKDKPQADGTDASQAKPEKKICHTENDTGSLLSRRSVCHTQAEWTQIEQATQDDLRRFQSNQTRNSPDANARQLSGNLPGGT